MKTVVMRPLLTAAVCGFFFAGLVSAEPQTFDFKDAKGVNHIAFELDAPLEAISGTANGVSGTVTFDPEDYTATKGSIVLDATTLKVTNSTMSDHMHGKRWMDTGTYGTITYEVASIENIKDLGDGVFTADAKGSITIKGTTKPLTTSVKFTYLEGKLGARTHGKMEGDLLVLRSTFSVKRSEFGINPGQGEETVSDEVVIRLAIAGASPK